LGIVSDHEKKPSMTAQRSPVPKGRLSQLRSKISAVPSGLDMNAQNPGVETPGYFRVSLRDREFADEGASDRREREEAFIKKSNTATKMTATTAIKMMTAINTRITMTKTANILVVPAIQPKLPGSAEGGYQRCVNSPTKSLAQ
jgi:hypothetical protein